MDWVHVHLLLNHVPVIGTVIGILLLAYAALRRSPEVARASLGLFVLLALVGAVVFLTGEPAEELVENLPGVSESLIEEHEEAALLATAALGAMGLLALVGLVAFRRRASGLPRAFVLGTLLFSLVPAATMAWTANLGGQIRHSEIRSGATAGGSLPADAGVTHD